MSYTAPTGNAVDFNQTGVVYTAPSGNAVDFQWVIGVPKYSLVSKSTLAFRAGSMFSLAGASVAAFDNPYRAFSIPSGSSAAFNTWQRAIAFDSGSSSLFRAGFIARVNSGSAASVFGHGLLRGAFAVNTGSLVDGRDQWIQNIVFSNNKSKTVALFAGAYNKDTAMRISGSSEFDPSPAAVKRSAFSLTPDSVGDFSSATVRQAAFGISSSGALSAAARATARAAAASFGQSAFTPYGHPALGGAALISGYSIVAFTSSFDFSAIEEVPEDADVAYCFTRQRVVRVLTA